MEIFGKTAIVTGAASGIGLGIATALAGIAYEYIRWTARHLDNAFVRIIIKPNLALQHLTTREPSLDMLEVSIAAFQTMRAEEEKVVV